jgi:hypothetical protein
MARVTKPGGIVAAREADHGGFIGANAYERNYQSCYAPDGPNAQLLQQQQGSAGDQGWCLPGIIGVYEGEKSSHETTQLGEQGMSRWSELYCKVARANGGEPDTGHVAPSSRLC